MPEFDPQSNGHREPEEDLPPLPPRGRGVLLLVSVSGLTVFGLLAGAIAGTAIGAAVMEGNALQLILGLAGIGAGVGVWGGIRMGIAYGGVSGEATVGELVLAGLGGLVAGVTLVSFLPGPFTPLLAVMMPGVAAVVTDVLLTRKLYEAHLAAGKVEPAGDVEPAPGPAAEQT